MYTTASLTLFDMFCCALRTAVHYFSKCSSLESSVPFLVCFVGIAKDDNGCALHAQASAVNVEGLLFRAQCFVLFEASCSECKLPTSDKHHHELS